MAHKLDPTEVNCVFMPCDVTDKTAIGNAVAQAVGRFGPLDVLVNNTGVNVFHEPLDTTEEEWR